MKPYRPNLVAGLDGGMTQTFTANVVHVDEALVAFGDVLPDDVRGLPYGTTVHGLLVHFDGRPTMIELNDQGNTRSIDALERTVLARDHVRFVFHRDQGPFAGRVSYSKEAEVFEDAYDKSDPVRLSAVIVRFALDDAAFKALRAKLARLLEHDA